MTRHRVGNAARRKGDHERNVARRIGLRGRRPGNACRDRDGGDGISDKANGAAYRFPRLRPFVVRPAALSEQLFHSVKSATIDKRRARCIGLAHRHVGEPHLHAFLALPAIDGEITGGMHGAAAIVDQRAAERRAGDAERNRIDEFAVA